MKESLIREEIGFIIACAFMLSALTTVPIIVWANYKINRELRENEAKIERMILDSHRDIQLTYAAYKQEETKAINALTLTVENLQQENNKQ